MLEELQSLHADILAGLAELDVLTAQPQPPMDRLPKVRLGLTRASRGRTLLLDRVYDRVIASATPDQREQLRALRSEGKDTLLTSTMHITTWTVRQVVQRWPEYCAASNILRAAMRERIRKEAALLYPLLSESNVRVSAA